jgi:hypothetical protein
MRKTNSLLCVRNFPDNQSKEETLEVIEKRPFLGRNNGEKAARIKNSLIIGNSEEADRFAMTASATSQSNPADAFCCRQCSAPD